MARLDIYSKKNKNNKVEHFFVPIYTHQVKSGSTKILPAPKGFTDIDETFTKVTSLYPNDYAQFIFGNKTIEGYYVMYGIAVGQIVLIKPTASDKSKNNLIQTSPRSAAQITRLDISVLGDNYPWS
jgi:hypothetical protein